MRSLIPVSRFSARWYDNGSKHCPKKTRIVVISDVQDPFYFSAPPTHSSAQTCPGVLSFTVLIWQPRALSLRTRMHDLWFIGLSTGHVKRGPVHGVQGSLEKQLIKAIRALLYQHEFSFSTWFPQYPARRTASDACRRQDA